MSRESSYVVRVDKERKNLKVYFSNPIKLPITINGGRAITGQDLPLLKARGEVELSASDREKFPYVINPDKPPVVNNNDVLDRGDSYDAAIIECMRLNYAFAMSKKEYDKNPQKYKFGWLENDEETAREAINDHDKAYRAESFIREMEPEARERFAKLISHYHIGKVTISGASQNVIKNQLVLLARNEPDLVIGYDPKSGANMSIKYLVVDLFENGIFVKDRMNVMYDGELFASTVREAESRLNKDVALKNKLSNQLDHLIGGTKEPDPIDQKRFVDQVSDLRKQAGTAMSVKELNQCRDEVMELMLQNSDDNGRLVELKSLGKYISSLIENFSVETAKRNELMACAESELMRRISVTKYMSIDDVEDYKEKKKELVDYMILKMQENGKL